jgi:hypothetical protein
MTTKAIANHMAYAMGPDVKSEKATDELEISSLDTSWLFGLNLKSRGLTAGGGLISGGLTLGISILGISILGISILGIVGLAALGGTFLNGAGLGISFLFSHILKELP